MIDQLLINATIHTLDADRPLASALAISRERIIAVGGAELRDIATSQTRVQDMGGALILPGLVDAHIHWEGTALALRSIDLADVPDVAEALRRVGQAAESVKPGAWLHGRGWSQSVWPGGEFPTASILDTVTRGNPAFLVARSGHAAWVNSAALRLAGITDNTPDPDGGMIKRNEHGAATGIFFESAIQLISDHIPLLNAHQIADLMLEAQALAHRSGLTGLHDFDDQSAFEALQILHSRGELGLRVVKNINKAFISHAIGLRVRWGFGDDWLRIGGLKLFADGALGSRTALMIDPYNGEPNNYGIVVTEKEEMAELVNAASRAGLPSTIHAIGDRAVHDVLDVYEAVRREEAANGIARSSRRHRIEHVQIIHPNDLHRLAELDVIASMQPIHATSDYPMADRYWGDRSRLSYNARAQIDAGASVAFGSDSPVEPFDPLIGIHAAVTRQRADGTPGVDGWYPEARLTLDEAIRGYTVGAAHAGGTEDRMGAIRPGYLADLVVLDRDIYALPPQDILKAHVIGTMVGGEWRFEEFS